VKIWVDAQLSPAIAAWMNRAFMGIEAHSVRSLGLLESGEVLVEIVDA